VALSLSDAFCVDRHRAAFRGLLPMVDILFANEVEICSLFEANSFEDAASLARQAVPLAVLTRSEAGSLILHGGDTIRIAAAPTQVVDTTGAGDCYAAGFLAAYTQGQALAACGELATRAAALFIASYGARPAAEAIAALR
jgi:fructokinase